MTEAVMFIDGAYYELDESTASGMIKAGDLGYRAVRAFKFKTGFGSLSENGYWVSFKAEQPPTLYAFSSKEALDIFNELTVQSPNWTPESIAYLFRKFEIEELKEELDDPRVRREMKELFGLRNEDIEQMISLVKERKPAERKKKLRK